MVAVISGSGLGIFGSSVSALGGIGGSGNAAPGRGNERVYVNTATGNLIVQSQDERLTALGLDLNLVRTYNSQGVLDDDNGDNWRLGVHQRLYNLTGLVNTAGSSITKVFGDGREVTYEYDSLCSSYVSSEGADAHDTLNFSGGVWTWQEGTTLLAETYDSNGRLTSSRDADGNDVSYVYTGSRLTRIDDASGQQTHFDYTGNNLTAIRVVSDGVTQTLTTYDYDTDDRLIEVTLDLSPSNGSDALSYVTTYTYDGASHRIASISQDDGTSVEFEYELIDGQHRVSTYTDGAGRVTSFSYTQPTGSSGGGGVPTSASANGSALSTTHTNSYDLNASALTVSTGGWQAAALLEAGNADASAPKIVFDQFGNGFAVWAQGSDVIARQYNASTATWSGAVTLDASANDAYRPALAVDRETGSAVVAWVQSDGVASSLYVRRYDAATNSWGTTELVESSNGGVNTGPEALSVSMVDGYAAIVWLQNDGTTDSVYLSRLVSGSWSSPALLEATNQTAQQTSVAIDANGNAIVLWRQYVAADAEYRIHSRYWNNTSQTLSTTTLLDDDGDRFPRIALDAQGNGFAVWSNEVQVRRFDATTGQWSTQISLKNGTGDAVHAEVAVDAEGNALVAWFEDDGSGIGCYARRFDVDTGSWGATALLGSQGETLQTDHILTVSLAGGEGVVGWVRDDGITSDVYSARLSGGVWTTATLLESRGEPGGELSSALDVYGNATVVWVQADGFAPSIYQAQYIGPYYVVPSGATWQSVANTLYGVNSVAAGNALQAAMGGGSLTTGIRLSGLPTALNVTSTVPAYYTVRTGDTWAHITSTVYGTADVNAIAELQSELSNPTLIAGLELEMPASIAYTTSGSFTAPLDFSATSSTQSQNHNLNTGALTTPAANWSAAALLETGNAEASAPQVAFDATGNGIAVWAQGSDIITRRFLASTGTWSTAVTLDASTQEAHAPTLSIDRQSGDAIIAWVQSDGVAESLYVRRYDASSTTWSIAQALESSSGAVDMWPQGASISLVGEHAAIAWMQDDGTTNSVYLSRLENGVWTPPALLEATDEEAMHPQVAINANGSTTVLWRQYSDGEFRIHSLRWDAPTQAYGSLQLLDDDGDRFPRLVFDAAGNAFAVWSGGVQVRRFDAATGLWGTQVSLQSGSNGTTSEQIAIDAAGNAVLAWLEDDGTAFSVYARRYDAATGTWGAATLLENSSHAADVEQRLAASIVGGEAVVAWVEDNGTTRDVYAARLSGGTWGTPTLLESRSESPSELTAAVDATGDATVVWLQADGAAPSIYQARLSRTPYYVVPSGATWQSVANTLYGVNSAAAGSALQAALASPTLTTGLHLQFLPATLVVTMNVPAYYVVQSGDTWASITETLYGTTDAEAVTALQTAMSNPTLTAGLALTIPSTLSYSSSSGSSGGVASYLQTEVTANGVVTRYEQDESGRLIAVTAAPGSLALRTEYEYDADGNVTAIIRDPQGLNRISRMTYDDDGNLLSQRDDLGNTLARTYDAYNQLLTETVYQVRDPDGAGSAAASVPLTTRYAYDSEHHLRFTVSPAGRVTEHSYDNEGQRLTTFTYTGALYAGSAFDTASLETWVAAQNRTQLQRVNYAYDFRGNLSSLTAFHTTDSSGAGTNTPSITRFVYDQRGQLLQTIEARSSGEMPDAGNINVPHATTYNYDGLGRVLSISQWNASGNVSTTLNAYDDADRATSVTLANGLVTTTLRNLAGEIISVINGTGAAPTSLGSTTYTYDLNGRLRFQTDPTGVRQFFEYDNAGRRVAQIDGDGTLTEFVYDDLDRIIKSVVYSTRVDSTTLGSLVDGAGQRTSVNLAAIRAAADDTPAGDRITRNVYDAAGLLIYEIDATGAVTQYFYDGAGRITDEVSYAQEVTIAASVDQVLDGSFSITPSSADRRTRHFYDTDGQRRGTLDAAGYLVEFIYDAAGQLVHQIGYANQTSSSYWSTGTLDQLRTSAGADEETSADPERDVHSYFFYDGQGRRIGVLDAEGYLTESVYDVAGNVTQQTRFDRVLTYTPGSSTFTSLRAAAVVTPAPVSHSMSFEYDGAGRVIRETNHEGVVTAYTYDSVGQLIATTRAYSTTEARTTETRYDYLGRVLQELTAEGRTQITVGMTPTQIDEIWQRYGVTYAYDTAGRRISATLRPNDTQTNVTLYYYDADGRLRFEISPLGEVKEFRYDAFGQLTDSIGYNEALASTAGLSGGLVNSALQTLVDGIADPAYDSHVTNTYTLRGQVSSILTAQGSQTSSTYTAFGQVETQQQSLTSSTSLNVTYSYDRRGQLTETQRDASGVNAIEERAYDAFGRLVSVTNANGHTRKLQYDRLGRTILTIGADGAERTTSYDAFDRVLTTTDALGASTTYAYNDTTRSTVVTTPEGISATTLHNRHGQTLSIAVAGNTTQYSYDLNGALTGVSDNLGTLESRTYDRAGRQLTSTDARGVTTAFTYDAANRVLTRVVDTAVGGLQLTTSYAYDAQGRIELVTDATGTQTRTTYDRDGRVTEVAVDPNDGLNIRTTYAYDLGGRVITTTEGAGSPNPRVTSYAYDALGRRTTEIVDPGVGTNPTTGREYLNLTTRYEYDDNGNVTRKINAEGYHTVFVYDAENRLKYTIDALNQVTRSDYDAEGRVVQTTRYGQYIELSNLFEPGTVITAAMVEGADYSSDAGYTNRTEQYVYDRDGREVFRVDAMGGVTRKDYDAAGNVIHQRMYSSRVAIAEYRDLQALSALLTPSIDDRQSWSTFDVRNQLRHSIDALGGVIAYEYDAAGNVVRKVAYATPISTTGTLDTPALEAWTATHSTADDQVTRTWYDAAGRVQYVVDAKSYLTQYAYDDLGRVTEEIKYADQPTIVGNVVTPAVNGPQDQHTISEYDAAGRLISVTDAHQMAETYDYDATGNRIEYINRNGARWTYVYDANRRLIEEHSPEVGIDGVYRGGWNDWMGYSGTLGPRLFANATVHDSIITQIGYDALGNVTSRTEAVGRPEERTTSYQYDELGRQTTVTHPEAGFYTRYSIDDDSMQENAWSWDVGYGVEEVFRPQSQTTYDRFGNAVWNRDVAGYGTGKYYDELGRVRYVLDAESYVTEYRYDTFGNQTHLIRYADRFTGGAGSTQELQQGLQADPNQDRTIVSAYDRLNRLVSVTQPQGLVFEPAVGAAGGQLDSAAAITTNTYDAFGRIIKQSQLAGLNGSTADTYYYYDQRNAKIAQVDALGYATTHDYDAVGNLIETVEYADALQSGAWDESEFDLPTESAGEDRKTEWGYDRLNRMTSETRVGVAHNTVVGGVVSSITDNQATTFGYDAVGNLTRRTQPSGLSTYTYYDALGRQIGTAGSSRDVGGVNELTPLTTMKRDALGNLVEQTVWALGTSSATEQSHANATSSAADRTTRFLVNSHNQVIQTYDADSGNHFAMYNERGELAREWTPIDEPDFDYLAHQRVTVYEYDGLGRLINTIDNGREGWRENEEGGQEWRVLGQQGAVYNSFGEVVGKGMDGVISEHFDYDQAGRLWRSNGDDGVYKIYLYNLLGQATAEIRSQVRDLSTVSAEVAATFTSDVLRTETRYDALGRVVEQRRPAFATASPDQVGIQATTINFSMSQRLGPNNPDAVYRLVISMPGYGERPVPNRHLVLDPGATVAQGGGWSYGTTPNSQYVRDLNYQLVSSRYIHWTPRQEYDASSRVRSVNITFEYRAAGDPNGAWTSLRVTDLPGGEVGVDTDALANGQYEYRVKYTRANQVAAYATSIGTLNLNGSTATFTDSTVASLAAENITPIAVTTQIPVNSQFRDANFTIGGFSGMPALNSFVYRRIVEGSNVTYVPDRGAPLSEDGGYYLTASGYVQKPGYDPETSLFVRWNRPSDTTLTPQFSYRLTGSSGDWQSLTTSTVGTQFSAAIGNLPDGQYEFRVTYTATGQTTAVATADGVFEIQPTQVGTDQQINVNPPDNAGTVAPIGNRPPGSSSIVSSVTSSAHVDAYTSGQMLMIGDNTVNVSFPSLSGPVRVELEYLTLAISAEDNPGPSGTGWPATTRRISLEVANASSASSGINLTWRDPVAAQTAGGISQVVSVRVYALDNEGAASLKYASDPASAASIGGTQVSWTAPWDTSIEATFNIRRPGAGSWVPMNVTRVGGDYTVDLAALGSGPWEYELIYETATGIQRSRTTGTLLVNEGASVNIHEDPGSGPYPIEPVADVDAVSTAPVEFEIGNSAEQVVTSPSYVIVNGQMQQHQPLGTAWDGSNELTLSWDNLGTSAEVKVEVEYTSAPRYVFNYTTSEPPHWEENPAFVPGQLTRRTVEGITNAAIGTTLTWQDNDAGIIGGIQQVHRVRVYTRVNSQWVLQYDRDAAAPTGGTSMYWSAPDDPAVDVEFQVREVGQTTWQTPTPTLHGGRYSVNLAALTTGNYEYQIKYSVTEASVTTPTAVTRGTFSIDTAGFSDSRTQVIDVEQSNVKFDDDATDIDTVSWDGANLAWSFAPTSGDTVVVRTREVGASTWQQQTIGGSGPAFSHALTAASGQAFEFDISYTHSGQSTPYAVTAGVLNTQVAAQTRPMTVAVTQQSLATTSIAQLTELWSFDGVLNWAAQSEAGTATFRYRAVNGTWQSITPENLDSGHGVDLRMLATGTYEYEIAYQRSSDLLPHTFTSGTITVGASGISGGLTIEDRTSYVRSVTQLSTQNVPTQTQTLDRWGNITSVTDVFGKTTHYRYNQLGSLIEMQQPEVEVVSTEGGTVVTSAATPVSRNYYDLSGRLVATEDANGNMNAVVYNTAGQILEEQHADGGVKRFEYDVFGQQVEVTDEGGYRTRNVYDHRGNLTQVSNETILGAFETIPTAIVTKSYTYDEASQRLTETNGESETITYRYDVRGNLARRISDRGFETTYFYDLQGNKIEERDANYEPRGSNDRNDSPVLTWQYDYFGRMTGHRDLGGASYSYVYGEGGQLLQQTSSLGQHLRYYYDTAGQLVRIQDNGLATGSADVVSSNKLTEYGYDLAGRRVLERTTVDGLLHQNSWTAYDALGRIATVTDPDFRVTYSYDRVGNRTHIEGDYYDHTGVQSGNLHTEDLWYTYDSMNRVLTSQGANVNGSIGINSAQGTQLTYNEKGERVTARTYGEHLATHIFSGLEIQSTTFSRVTGAYTEVYSYDGLGRLILTTQESPTDTTDWVGNVEHSTTDLIVNQKSYDGASRVTLDISWSLPNSGSTLQQIAQTTTYDDDGRPMQQITTKNGIRQTRVIYGDAQWVAGRYRSTSSLFQYFRESEPQTVTLRLGSSSSGGSTSSRGSRPVYATPPSCERAGVRPYSLAGVHGCLATWSFYRDGLRRGRQPARLHGGGLPRARRQVSVSHRVRAGLPQR